MEETQKQTFKLKVVVLGCDSVGKSSLLSRYCDKFEICPKVTIGFNLVKTEVKKDGCLLQINLMDTPGCHKYSDLFRPVCQHADGYILVYDVTRRHSFEMIPYLLYLASRQGADETVKILVGNKTDVQARREVSTSEGQDMADTLGFQFFETSAMESTKVMESFDALASALLAKKRNWNTPASGNGNRNCVTM